MNTEARLRMSDLPVKILIFYIRNPEEVLSIEDVCQKWNVTYERAQAAMYRLMKNQWLARVPSKDRVSLYEIGPLLEQELNAQ